MAAYQVTGSSFTSLPYKRILVLTKLKAFAVDKFNVTQMMISVSDKEKNVVEKGENTGNVFKSLRLSLRPVKTRD